jgi:hypothetical protein
VPLPVDLTTTAITGTYPNASGAALTGTLTFTPSADLVDTVGHVVIRDAPITVTLGGGTFTSPGLANTDNANLSPSGWYWTVTENIAGLVPRSFSFYLPASLGASVDIDELIQISPPAPAGLAYVLKPWEFHVANFGAKGDDTTDDTAAILDAITTGVTYAQAHDGYAEIVFDPLTYLVAGNPTTGGATQGSAQLPLPMIAQTAQKVTLVLRGTVDQSGLYHWLQTVPQRAGTVLRSTYSGGDALPATGEVSVIGGPTPHYVNNPPTTWNNMLIVVDGIGIEVPATVDVCGFDFRGMAEANVPNAATLAAHQGVGAPPVPAPNWAFGLAMPMNNNNDNCNVGIYSCEGMVYGLIVYEHAHVTSARLINCFDGLVCWSGSGFPHRNKVEYVSIEGCTQSIVFAGSFNKMDVDCADLEWGTGHIINDAGATPALGRIGLASNGNNGTSLSAALSTGATAVNVVGGALALEVTNLDQQLGPVGPPAVPASNAVFANPYWRSAEVKISGGAVSGIAIDGVNQLLTSGTHTVPSGHTITLTYTVAPSWVWTLK